MNAAGCTVHTKFSIFIKMISEYFKLQQRVVIHWWWMGRVQGAVASQYWAPRPGLASRHTVSPLNSRARGVTTCSMCDTVIACHRVKGMMLLFRSFRGMCVWDLKHLPLHRSLCDTMWDVTQCNCLSVTPCACVTPGAALLIVWHCVTVWHYVSVTPCNCVTRLPWAECVWHL